MSRKIIVKIVAGIIFLAAMLGIILWANKDKPGYESTKDSGREFETAKVLSVISDDTVVDETVENVLKGQMELEVEILTGRYKGTVSHITNYFSALYNVKVKEGDTISVRIDTTEENQYSVSVYNYNRIPLMIGLVVFFFLSLTLIGGKQGIKAFLGLVYTVVCIMFILLPLALKGVPTVPLTCAIIFVTSAVCFILIGGIQRKTVAAALGSMCGVLIAALLGKIATIIGGVTAFQMEEAEILLLVRADSGLQIRGLLISGILIAAMGAVMDVSMSIASALEEVYAQNHSLTFKDLFRSGMNIGKDAMGTMANTLVLAYVGSALNTMIYIYSYGVSMVQLLNTDFVAIEMIRAVAGSVGIIFTVPCVSAISSYLYIKKKK